MTKRWVILGLVFSMALVSCVSDEKPAWKGQTHRVVQGDTLYGLSKKYGVSTRAIIEANELQSPYVIKIGQILKVPGLPSSVPSAVKKKPAAAPNQNQPPSATPSEQHDPPFYDPPFYDSGNDGVARQSSLAHLFSWPLKGQVIGEYGQQGGGVHNDGINIAAPAGTPIRAADEGEVAFVGQGPEGFGNLLLIKHNGEWLTTYAHAKSIMVQKGDRVKRGQVVGLVGKTGKVKSPQLHFEIRHGSKAVNPLNHLE